MNAKLSKSEGQTFKSKRKFPIHLFQKYINKECLICPRNQHSKTRKKGQLFPTGAIFLFLRVKK